jgi:hypothetical protein
MGDSQAAPFVFLRSKKTGRLLRPIPPVDKPKPGTEPDRDVFRLLVKRVAMRGPGLICDRRTPVEHLRKVVLR